MPSKRPVKKIAVLGAGRVGRTIALDLATCHDVCVMDADSQALARFKGSKIRAVAGDATREKSLASLLRNCDLAINALPGHLGFGVLKNIIRCGTPVVDISFFAEDALELGALAQKNNVTAVVDCGIAPGFSNMVLGRHTKEMTVAHFSCYVGGLPKTRVWPYQYKAPFSPIDVIEEYTRPARLMENNVLVTRPALSEFELLDFPGIGTLEAFNTDGLRTLLKTVNVPNMREKTLRYPGHSEYIRVLRDSGFFDNRPMDIKGTKISPLELTARVLFPHWQLKDGEEEFTVMRISIEGLKDGKPATYTYNLHDSYDRKTQLTSMSRTTGYTCTAVAQMLLNGTIRGPGIVPPEFIGMDQDKFAAVVTYLRNKGISLEVRSS